MDLFQEMAKNYYHVIMIKLKFIALEFILTIGSHCGGVLMIVQKYSNAIIK